jgi:hypothetical protein
METQETYQEWIENYQGDIHRKCYEVCQEMQQSFPELVLVKGTVELPALTDKPQPHWWLITPKDDIVDPTKGQWGTPVVTNYKEIKCEITGKCANCGGYICNGYDSTVCCGLCGYQFAASMGFTADRNGFDLKDKKGACISNCRGFDENV